MVNLLSKKTSSFNVNPMFLWYSQLIYNANQLTGFNLKVKLILKLKTLEKLSFSLLHFETFFHWNTSANLTNRSSHRRYSIKNGVLKNFAKFAGKYLYKSPFLNTVARWRLQLYLKRDSDTGVFLRILIIFKKNVLQNTSRWLIWAILLSEPKTKIRWLLGVKIWKTQTYTLNNHDKYTINWLSETDQPHRNITTYFILIKMLGNTNLNIIIYMKKRNSKLKNKHVKFNSKYFTNKSVIKTEIMVLGNTT